MTAMFVVIFLEQWRKDASHASAILGAVLSVACLLLFGADGFMLPAMLAILGSLILLRQWEKRRRQNDLHTTASHHRRGDSRHHAHPLSSLSPLPAPQAHAAAGARSGAAFARGGVCTSGGLLPEKRLLTAGSHGIPEAIAIAVVVALHLWKRQTLLSIAGGTVVYMLLVQTVF